ncbi:MAG: LamB/YcsF family protein [Jatrophihabitantaceae bacterium]
MIARLDLNADLGEGFGHWAAGDDEALLAVVSSANVACGFHAGDPVIMRRVCEQAVHRNVSIGAQVSYRDLVGFGRRRIEMAPDELTAEVLYQIGALDGFARAAGDRVRYLKPHGALYHAAATDPAQAGALVAAVQAWPEPLPVLTLPGGELHRQAIAAGLACYLEAFADRGYLPDGNLQSRREPGAVLTDPAVITERVRRLAESGALVAVDGTVLDPRPDSLCLHGDTPGAVAIARAVRATLEQAGVEITRFA